MKIELKIFAILLIIFSLTIIGKNLFVSSDIKAPGEKKLSQYYSGKKLGSFVKDGKTYFRLFAPSAMSVKLVKIGRASCRERV